ncbi:protein ref(2)P [Calliphora vicina]|uniref:protein ref(2)P n=1 Tax=Calliphora vicina TaxID=7373 RepID=UPI00325B4A95
MDQNFLKITYHLGAKKMNAYLKMPSPTYHVLKKEIEMCIFEERKQPRCEIRTFWIDEDHDEIEIINQCDYEIFMTKRSLRQHLQVAPIGATAEEQPDGAPAAAATKASVTTTSTESATTNQATVPPAAGSYDFAVHEHVECDACLMAPIMGFRYKCIQCPNYDLCQNCESKHIHSEHMMVRMPTNNCPNVIEAYVTGRTSRRHGKRSKTSCPVVKNGLSVVIDDELETGNATGTESADQSSPANGKEQQRHRGRNHHHRRHHRNNFFSHLYEMMHDLAEGGGAAAAAHAMGETTTSTKSSTSTTGPQTTTTSTTATNVPVFENETTNNIAAAAAAAAHMAAQKAHETAVKTAEIAAKIAHESAVQAAKNVNENTVGAPSTSASATAAATADVGEKEKEATKEKVDATTSPRDFEPQPNPVPVMPSPSLESLAQFLDPQYMKTGIQILNNFSDMFAKMLDPMDVDGGENQIYPNLRKNSTTSTKSSVSSNPNSLGSDKKSASENLIEKEQQNQEQTMEAKQPESDASSHVEIDDLGSDSENDSVSESFIKLDAPKEANIGTPSSYKSTSAAASAQTTPPQSLDKSKVMDFAQLSADLKAHIAEEAANDSSSTTVETTVTATNDAVDNANGSTTTITSTTTASEPVVTTSSTTTSTTTTPGKPEEKRAVPVYHVDQRINNAVHAMMSMGFSNEGAWLTQLLENVNGNISEALDLMSVAQRGGSR